MFVHRSNRLEALIELLAEVTSSPLGTPFGRETIVVQSRGMERWVALELSRRAGVLANADFPFPRAFVDRVLEAVLGDSPEVGGRYTRYSLLFSLARLLSAQRDQPEFLAVGRYLGQDPTGHKRFELSLRLADLFDQYAVYRPELVLDWEEGHEGDWQAVLWRAVSRELGPGHLAARAKRFFACWPELGVLPAGLPERVSVFGISTLPPIYLRLLSALGQRLSVHLFLLTPSREYVAEIRSRREILRQLRAQPHASPEELHLREGNPLLASLGRLGRDLQEVLETATEYHEPSDDLFEDPGTDTLLHTLQSDILAVRHRGRDADAPRLPLGEDHSLRVNVCHSPLRELEVLEDELRALFEADRTLMPHDVLVAAPNIETYAPFIAAIFGRNDTALTHIPHRLADRSQQAENPVADAFLELLRLVDARVGASDLLDLLQKEPVMRRFRLAREQVELVRRWVRETGIRWGVDADDRALESQPPCPQNTWRFGLERLLLGYAMPGAGRELFRGVLPYDDVEGSDAETLEQFIEFAEVFFSMRRAMREPRSFSNWRSELDAPLTRMLRVADADEWQVQVVRDAIAMLAARAEAACFSEPVVLDVVARLLQRSLAEEQSTHDFLAGGVNFCSLLPMRSIPFRVVCLLGLNDSAFPRRESRLPFDLLAAAPQPGDRSLREEDRTLFLEALLSARDRLIISYCGRSVQDDREEPPSVVLDELLNWVDESFCDRVLLDRQTGFDFLRAELAARDHILVEHPLQAFSRRYFDGSAPPLFSYREDARAAAQVLAGPSPCARRFLERPLPPPSDAGAEISLEQLAKFLENPARALLRQRLGIVLDAMPDLVGDREPIVLGPLEKYRLGDGLLRRVLAGEDLDQAYELVRAEGVLPLGTPGQHCYSELAPEVLGIADVTRHAQQGAALDPVEFDLELGEHRLVGVLRDLWGGAQVRAQFARVKAKTELSTWVHHLALQVLRSSSPKYELPSRTVLVGRMPDPAQKGLEVVAFTPVDPAQAQELLRALLGLYRLGLSVPLCFFPRASRALVETLLSSSAGYGVEEKAREAAREVYRPVESSRSRGDADDAYVKILFRDLDPLDADFRYFSQEGAPNGPTFAELSRLIFEPLLTHIEADR